MSRLVKIAVGALPGKPGGETDEERRESNIAAAEGHAREAAEAGADIVCFPEMFAVHGISGAGEEDCWYEPLGEGQCYRRMSDAARTLGIHVIAPILATENGKRRNVAVLFGPDGGQVGAYYKVHLTEVEANAWDIVPGDEWPVFDLPFGRVGITICFDIMFPEAFRIPALKGAEMIFHPTVYSMFGEIGWESMVQSRAIDNCVYICPVNYGIGDNDPWMPGMCLNRSSVIGPDGIPVVDRGRYAGVAVAEIDLDRPRMVMAGGASGLTDYRAHVWRNRRPDTYGELAEPGHWVASGYTERP